MMAFQQPMHCHEPFLLYETKRDEMPRKPQRRSSIDKKHGEQSREDLICRLRLHSSDGRPSITKRSNDIADDLLRNFVVKISLESVTDEGSTEQRQSSSKSSNNVLSPCGYMQVGKSNDRTHSEPCPNMNFSTQEESRRATIDTSDNQSDFVVRCGPLSGDKFKKPLRAKPIISSVPFQMDQHVFRPSKRNQKIAKVKSCPSNLDRNGTGCCTLSSQIGLVLGKRRASSFSKVKRTRSTPTPLETIDEFRIVSLAKKPSATAGKNGLRYSQSSNSIHRTRESSSISDLVNSSDFRNKRWSGEAL